MRKEKGARTPARPCSRSNKPFLTKGTRMNTPLQHPQTGGKRFCPGCGSQLKPEAKFCTHCGKQLGDRLFTSQLIDHPAKQGSEFVRNPSSKQVPSMKKQGKSNEKQDYSPVHQLNGMGILSLVLSAATTVCMFLPWITVPTFRMMTLDNQTTYSFNPVTLLNALFKYGSNIGSWNFNETLSIATLFAIAWIAALAFLTVGTIKNLLGSRNQYIVVAVMIIAFLVLLDFALIDDLGSYLEYSTISMGNGAVFSLFCALGAAGTCIASKIMAD